MGLEHDLIQICKRYEGKGKGKGYASATDRLRIARQMARDLIGPLRFPKTLSARDLRGRHVNKLLRQWQEYEKLSIGTIKNRPPSALRQRLSLGTQHAACQRRLPTKRRRRGDEKGFWKAYTFHQLNTTASILQGWFLACHCRQEAGVTQMYQGLAEHSQTGNVLYQLWYLILLADAYRQHEQISAGLDTLTEAAAISRPFFESELYRLKGELLLMQSLENQVEAEACFDHALSCSRQQAARSWELRVAMSLSRLWQQQGKGQAAYELLAPIYDWFTEGFDTADLIDAKQLVEELSAETRSSTV